MNEIVKTSSQDEISYFAYGSNMLPARLRERVPSARALGAGVLRGFELRFHKRGRDGSAKCDAYETGDFGDRVRGVLYDFPRAERAALDAAEGLGRGYALREAEIRVGDSEVSAFLYVAQAEWIDPTLRPFDWYKTLVVAGAVESRFPDAYVSAIDGVEAMDDPDTARREAAWRLLP